MIEMSDFPLLIPQDGTGRWYDGYIQIGKSEFRMELKIPPSNSLSDLEMICEWNLQEILDEYMTILKQRMENCGDVTTFLKEMVSLVENKIESDSSPEFSSDLTTYILEEMEKIGWEKLHSADANFQNITLITHDQKNREHFLKLRFNSQDNSTAPTCSTNLPHQLVFRWNSKNGIVNIFKEFEDSLKQYEGFWNEMDDIDSKTWVLEPDKANYAAVYRRIVIGTNASIQLQMDPKQPRAFPECMFLGADNITNPLKENLNKNLYKWDLNRSLLSNLETVLDITFPSPTNSKKEDFSVECGICYSYKMEQSVPDIVCVDKRCGQPFHQSCLYEWLRSLPTSRQSFNTIYGECPFCNKGITVKMPVK